MPTVEIDGEEFETYASLEDANKYMKGVFNNSTWFDPLSDPETKARALVTATRLLDKQCWKGEKLDSSQPLQWPREVDGVSGTPDAIVQGCIELANLIINGSDVVTNVQPGVQTIQSLKAGSVAMSFFRDAESLFTKNARFPVEVQELIGPYLCGSTTAISGSMASGTDGYSVTNEPFGFSEGL